MQRTTQICKNNNNKKKTTTKMCSLLFTCDNKCFFIVKVVKRPQAPVELKSYEVEEMEVTPTIIDRPKPEPLVKEQPREESPERERIQPVEKTVPKQPVEEVGEVVEEEAIQPAKIPKKELPPFKQVAETEEEKIVPEMVTKKIVIPDKELSDKFDKTGGQPIGEPAKRKPDLVPEYDTMEEAQAIEEVPPEFTDLLKPQIIQDGNEVTMTCTVVGIPTPVVKWYKDDHEIIPSTDFKIEYEENTGVCKLTIPEVFTDDTGVYACAAKNPFGESVTTANLVVQRKCYIKRMIVKNNL